VSALQDDISTNIAGFFNITAEKIKPFIVVTIGSNAGRRLLASVPVSFLILGNITTVTGGATNNNTNSTGGPTIPVFNAASAASFVAAAVTSGTFNASSTTAQTGATVPQQSVTVTPVVSPAISSSSSSSSGSALFDDRNINNDGSSGLSGGAIAGAVIGSIIGAIIIIAACILIPRFIHGVRKTPRAARVNDINQAENEMEMGNVSGSEGPIKLDAAAVGRLQNQKAEGIFWTGNNNNGHTAEVQP